MEQHWAVFLRQGWIAAAEEMLRKNEEIECTLGEYHIKIQPRSGRFADVYKKHKAGWGVRRSYGSAERFVDYLISCVGGLPLAERQQALNRVL